MSTEQKLFGFQGRLRRRDWWLFYSLALLVSLAVWALVVAAVHGSALPFTSGARPSTFNWVAWEVKQTIALAVFSLALMGLTFAVSVKRLHDRARSGRWLVLLYLLWLSHVLLNYMRLTTGGFLGLSHLNALGVTLFASALAVFVWLHVEMGVLEGTPGPNRFGPSPKSDG